MKSFFCPVYVPAPQFLIHFPVQFRLTYSCRGLFITTPKCSGCVHISFSDVPLKYMWQDFVTKLRCFQSSVLSIIDRPHNEDTRVSSAGGLVEVCISFPLLQLLGFGSTSLQTIALCELQCLSSETQDCRSLFNPKWRLEMFLQQVLLCQPC